MKGLTILTITQVPKLKKKKPKVNFTQNKTFPLLSPKQRNMTKSEAFIVAMNNINNMSIIDFDNYLSNTHTREELNSMSFEDKKRLIEEIEYNYIANSVNLDTVYGNQPVYNVVGDIGFSILTTNPDNPSKEEIIYALERRLKMLKDNPDEISEAIGINDFPDEAEDLEGINRWKNGTMKSEQVTIYIAVVSNKFGKISFIDITKQGLNRKIAEYCKVDWSDCNNQEKLTGDESDEEIINMYFDSEHGNTDEDIDYFSETIST